jgi:uncharacterized membrane protein
MKNTDNSKKKEGYSLKLESTSCEGLNYCSECGGETGLSDKFCRCCGKKQNAQEESPEKQKNTNTPQTTATQEVIYWRPDEREILEYGPWNPTSAGRRVRVVYVKRKHLYLKFLIVSAVLLFFIFLTIAVADLFGVIFLFGLLALFATFPLLYSTFPFVHTICRAIISEKLLEWD